MQEFLNSEWFSIGGLIFTNGEVLGGFAFTLFCIVLFWFVRYRFLPGYFERTQETLIQTRRVYRATFYILLLAIATGLVTFWDMDQMLFPESSVNVRMSTLLKALLILQVARITDWIISRIVLRRYYERRGEEPFKESKEKRRDATGRTVQFAVYVFALILILTNFNIDYELFRFSDSNDNVFVLRITNLLSAILVMLIAQLFAWGLTEIFLYSYFKRTNVPVASQYAFNQILRYVIFTIAVIVAINQLGVNTTLLIGGLAALLVGVGLGLQQTFNDFFSGVILLFERSVELGDVLDLNGTVGTVRKIGIRASEIETLENVTLVVPNSLLVTQNVVNWSHTDKKVRFWVTVSVAYGSDAQHVKSALLQAASSNRYLMKTPAPFVRLIEFADSGIVFELHFWSYHFLIIEDIKSDLRIRITEVFKQEGITIPFPQRDVWFRNPLETDEEDEL